MPKIPFDIYIGTMWGLIMCFTLQGFFPKGKRVNNTTFLYSLIITIFVLFMINNLQEPLRFILVFFVVFLNILLLYKVSIIKSLLYTIIYYFIEGLGCVVALLIFLNILHKDYVSVQTNLLYRFIIYVIIALVCFTSIKIINLPWNLLKKLNLKKFFSLLKIKDNTIFYLLSIFLLFSASVYFTWSYNYTRNDSRISLGYIYALFLLPATFLIAYTLLKLAKSRKLELSAQKKQYEELMLYTDIVERLSTNLRKHNHDFYNILIAQRGFIDQNNWEGLKTYFFEEVLKEQESLKTSEYIYLNIQNISHPTLKGLCLSKLARAVNSELNISLTIIDKITTFPIGNIDLNRMVGILLDNAIEAAILSDEKKFSFSILRVENETSIIIANSFSGNPDIESISKEGYSTKGDCRGLGLSILNELLIRNKKNVSLLTTIEEHTFIQELKFS